MGRFAVLDRAGGVAFDLIAAAEFEVAADGSEPPFETGRIGAGFPEVGHGGRVGLAQRLDRVLGVAFHGDVEPAVDGVGLRSEDLVFGGATGVGGGHGCSS